MLLLTCCYLLMLVCRGGKGKELEKNRVSMEYSGVVRAQSSSGGIIPVTSSLVGIGSATVLSVRPLYKA